MLRRAFLASTLFLLPVLAADLPAARPQDVGLSAERLARIRTAMQRHVDRGEVAGVVTLVARRGRIAHVETVGLMDLEAKKPMKADAIFRIASMTKPIASVAAMMLYEEGRFLLTDPVSKFIPEFKNPTVAVLPRPGALAEGPFLTVPAEREITVRDLLTHTSGLASGGGITASVSRELAAQRKPEDTVGDVTRRLAKMPLKFHPGAGWDYGLSTDALGHLVEVISGMTLDQFFQERICKPLGMTDTHFYLPEEKLPRLAANYAAGENGKARRVPAGPADRGSNRYFSGGGGLRSTASDYLRFHQLMLNGGELDGVRLLGRKTVELMTSNHIGDLAMWPTLRGYRFGLGYRVRSHVGESAISGSVGEYGWGGAYGTYFWVDPKEQMIGILMVQVRPYTHLNIRQDFQVLANAAIID